MITLAHNEGGPPPPQFTSGDMESFMGTLEEAMTRPLPSEDEIWIVGVTPVPDWVPHPDFETSLDEHGNAYFQFSDRAIIVPKGGRVYREEGIVFFGEQWFIEPIGETGALSRGILYLPEDL